MRRLIGSFIGALALLATPAFADVGAEVSPEPKCAGGSCTLRLTAPELLDRAQQLVSQHRFEEAAPMLAALENAPQLAMEREFLIGYSAVEQGRVEEGIKAFRRLLAKNPEQTRARLELGRALMLKGKTQSADYHFRLAQQDANLPKDVLDFVRTSRATIRTQRRWAFNMDFGLAPDSNITNGTNAETINVNLGPITLPLALDEQARRKSGTGQFFTLSGSARISLKGETRMLIEADGSMTNYSGKAQDDQTLQLAAGPEFDIGTETSMSVQAVGANRWYGGRQASRSFGVRSGIQHNLDWGSRVGFTLDARRTVSGFNTGYSGWQLGGYASYERVFARSLIGSATLFARRDALKSAPYASIETGANLAIGGDLPLGLTAGLSGGVSRAWFDKPLAFLSSKPRSDWRLNGRVSLGVRAIRVFGFSPSVSYNYSSVKSSLTLYQAERSRFRFALARYF